MTTAIPAVHSPITTLDLATPAPGHHLGSVLARIVAPEDPSALPSPEPPRYSPSQLRQLNSDSFTRAGQAFFILDRKGKLLRRGLCLRETERMYVCQFVGLSMSLVCPPRSGAC